MNVLLLCAYLLTAHHVGRLADFPMGIAWFLAFLADTAIYICLTSVRAALRAPKMEDHP